MDPFLIATGVAAAGLLFPRLFRYFNRRRRILRALAAMPRSAIAEVKDGMHVRVVGRLAYLGAPLTAPLTGRPCAFYELEVDEDAREGKGRCFIRETMGQDFLLRDDTGKALVRLEAPHAAVDLDTRIKSGVFHPPTPEMEVFLARRGERAKGWVFYRSLAYREGVLEEGELVTVSGVGHWERDPSPDPGTTAGYRDVPMRLVLAPARDIPLRVSDTGVET